MKPKRNRTQNLFQTLSNSSGVIAQFESIIDNCKRSNIKYEDTDFYPSKEIQGDDKNLLKEHVWQRIEEQYPTNLFENISTESIQQGELGDCYFVVALIYASRDKNLVKYLFHPKSSLEYGIVLVYFWFLGERIPVIVDTQIPYHRRNSKSPLFCHPRSNNDSCWFVLVEKAFAKACGGFWSIVEGQSHYGMHVLFDYFSTCFNEIEKLEPPLSFVNDNELHFPTLNDEFIYYVMKLKEKNAMIGTSISEKNVEVFDKSLGLIPDHAYYILDAVEYKKDFFVKIRNPWGSGKFNGLNKKTENFKKEMGFKKDEEDGSFWMHLDNFFYYFHDVCYSVPKEKNWKETSVFGKIDGYLDGRSPCSESKNVGCIPQWKIKFSQKTVVRLMYEVSGPDSFHGIFICKNHGEKVYILTNDINTKDITTNSYVNGIQYKIIDFSEPYTFFFIRSEPKDEPCYFRILIQSPDSNFVVEKFNDDFMVEKWNSASDIGIFNSKENDQWNPYKSIPLTTCKQWYINFPNLMKNDHTELRFRIFKNISEGHLYLFFARTDHRISYSYHNLSFSDFKIYNISDYEEISIQISNKNSKVNDGDFDDNSFKYVFAIYRNEQNDVNRFKFVALSKSKFEFGLMPGPDPTMNCGYTINGKFIPGKKDGATPYQNTVDFMKQWCLMFKKSLTTLYLDFKCKNSKSEHHVYIEIRENPGQKINTFYKGTLHYDFHIKEECPHDLESFVIEDITKPYSLCVTRDVANSASEYTLNIFGTEQFDMFEIDNDNIGKKVAKFKKTLENKSLDFDFSEVKFIEQPINFSPKSINFDENRNLHSKENTNNIHLEENTNNLHSEENENNLHFEENTNNNNCDDDDAIFAENENYEEESIQLIEKAKLYLKEKEINCFYLAVVSKVSKKVEPNYIFVLSELEIIILRKKFLLKTMKKVFNGKLTNLCLLSKTERNSIKIQFKDQKSFKEKEIQIQANNQNSLINAIINHISRFLTSIELKRITIQNMPINDLETKSSNQSIYSRFDSQLFKKIKNISKKIRQKYQLSFYNNSSKIDLIKTIKIKKFASILFPCIFMDRNINQIDIIDPSQILPILINNVELFDNISHVKIRDSDSKMLQVFIDKSKNINSISFYNISMKTFDYISVLIENDKIYSIGFDSSLDENSFRSFLQIPSFNKLHYFRVSNLKNVDLSYSIEYFQHLSVLSLTSCNLSIGEVLESFLPNFSKKLTKIDLSGNIGNGFSIGRNNSKSFPNHIKTLFVNDVKWEVGQLNYFINICSRSDLTTLSIDRIYFDNNDNINNVWNSLFNNLPNGINSLNSLNWNSNKIDVKFITFLENSLNLLDISFCGCECSDLEYIKTLLINKKIRSVNLKEIHSINQNQFNNFLANIADMKSLKQIDISHNNLDNNSIRILETSLINSDIESIAFDDSISTSYNDLISMYEKLENEKTNLIRISYPIIDIQRLNLNNQEISLINEKLLYLRKPLSERNSNPIKYFPQVYFLNLDINFPEFINTNDNNGIHANYNVDNNNKIITVNNNDINNEAITDNNDNNNEIIHENNNDDDNNNEVINDNNNDNENNNEDIINDLSLSIGKENNDNNQSNKDKKSKEIVTILENNDNENQKEETNKNDENKKEKMDSENKNTQNTINNYSDYYYYYSDYGTSNNNNENNKTENNKKDEKQTIQQSNTKNINFVKKNHDDIEENDNQNEYEYYYDYESKDESSFTNDNHNLNNGKFNLMNTNINSISKINNNKKQPESVNSDYYSYSSSYIEVSNEDINKNLFLKKNENNKINDNDQNIKQKTSNIKNQDKDIAFNKNLNTESNVNSNKSNKLKIIFSDDESDQKEESKNKNDDSKPENVYSDYYSYSYSYTDQKEDSVYHSNNDDDIDNDDNNNTKELERCSTSHKNEIRWKPRRIQPPKVINNSEIIYNLKKKFSLENMIIKMEKA